MDSDIATASPSLSSMPPPSPASCSGLLTFIVEEAKNLRSTTFLTRQNPFCICSVNGQMIRTPIHKSGGFQGSFHYPVSFELDGTAPLSATMLSLEMRSDNGDAEDLIGHASVPVSALLAGSSFAWYPLEASTPAQPAGEVLISNVAWYPKRIAAPPSPLSLGSVVADSPLSVSSARSLPAISELSLPPPSASDVSTAASPVRTPLHARRASMFDASASVPRGLLRHQSMPNLNDVGRFSEYRRISAVPLC